MFCENYDKLGSNLEGRGFTVHSAASGEEAKKLVLELIGDRASVGCGGSMSISSLGLPDALRAQGNPVYFHWDVKPEERAEIFEKAKEADWYLCSTNAITMNAKLINIDGNSNRVAAMFGGPKKVVLVVGKNKLAADLESGMARVKAVACSKNAQRFGLDTPCAITGKCVDCHHAQRICSVTTIIEQKPRLLDELHIVLVDEELGY